MKQTIISCLLLHLSFIKSQTCVQHDYYNVSVIEVAQCRKLRITVHSPKLSSLRFFNCLLNYHYNEEEVEHKNVLCSSEAVVNMEMDLPCHNVYNLSCRFNEQDFNWYYDDPLHDRYFTTTPFTAGTGKCPTTMKHIEKRPIKKACNQSMKQANRQICQRNDAIKAAVHGMTVTIVVLVLICVLIVLIVAIVGPHILNCPSSL